MSIRKAGLFGSLPALRWLGPRTPPITAQRPPAAITPWYRPFPGYAGQTLLAAVISICHPSRSLERRRKRRFLLSRVSAIYAYGRPESSESILLLRIGGLGPILHLQRLQRPAPSRTLQKLMLHRESSFLTESGKIRQLKWLLRQCLFRSGRLPLGAAIGRRSSGPDAAKPASRLDY